MRWPLQLSLSASPVKWRDSRGISIFPPPTYLHLKKALLKIQKHHADRHCDILCFSEANREN